MDNVRTFGPSGDRAPGEWVRTNGSDPVEDAGADVTPIPPRARPAAIERTASAAAAAAPARTGAPAIGTVVTVDPACVDPHLVAVTREDFAATSEYDRLAVSLMLGAADRGFRRVMIASVGRGDGRTSVAINLASALAAARRRVLLVEVDFAKPAVARMLGFEAETGLAEALRRDGGLEQAAVRADPMGFDFVPLSAAGTNPLEALAAPALQSMLAAADEHYDFVLFDAPPLTEAAATSLLVHLVDTTLLVVRPGATSSADMARAIAPLSEDAVFGVVLNRATR
jgi:succinoglycan biosynthesis transport protein ExoP